MEINTTLEINNYVKVWNLHLTYYSLKSSPLASFQLFFMIGTVKENVGAYLMHIVVIYKCQTFT